jgi:threonine/homoserine/homoserine lactone efflux protein
VNKSITESKKTGLVSAAGISFGVMFHTLLASLGLSIILAKSAMAFSIVKYVGAGYLIYLGIKAVKQKNNILDSVQTVKVSQTKLSKVFWMATLTNVLNPKVALFFLAFFPQFVKSGSEGTSQGFLFLGTLYAVMSLIWLVILATFVSTFSDKIRTSEKAQNIIQKVSGVAFIYLGIKIAISKK